MGQYRRRDNGALVQARQATQQETVQHGRIWRPLANREGKLMLDMAGQAIYRPSDEPHTVTAQPGEWFVFDGDACSVFTDEGFQAWATGPDEFLPHIDMSPQEFVAQAQHEANEAVQRGERLHELHGANQDPIEVQQHAIDTLTAVPGMEERVMAIQAALDNYQKGGSR